MDFLEQLINYIERSLLLSVSIKVGQLDRAAESIAIRPTPSNVSGRFMDKGSVREYTFQVLSKNPSQYAADATLQQITSLLDGLGNNAIKSANNSFKLVKCQVYVLPNYVEKNTHDEYIYTALFTAELQGGI